MNRKIFPIATIALLLSACGVSPFASSSTAPISSEPHTHTTTIDPTSDTHHSSEQPTSESSSEVTSESSSKTSKSTTSESKTTTQSSSESTSSQSSSSSESTTSITPTSESTTIPQPTSESSSAIPHPTSESTATPQPTSESTTIPKPTSESTTIPTPTSESTTVPKPTSESTTIPQPTSESTTVPQPTSESTTVPQPTSESTTVPQPTSESTTVPEPTSESSSTTTIPQPTSEDSSGTSATPIRTYTSVSQALSIISGLEIGETTEESYTVIGKITTAVTTMATGALQFKVQDLNGGTGRLYIDGGMSTVGTPVKGDTVVAVGTLKRHADTDYRMTRGCSIVDINPIIPPEPTSESTSTTVDPSTSTFAPITGQFTATFYNENGELIKSQVYNAYDTPSCTYSKPSTEDTDYVLKGWSLYLGGPVVTVEPITHDVSYYAVIEAKPYQFIGNEYSDFQIHFLELGNWYTGDCVYIKAGSNDILIDAGSRQNSASTIRNYLDDNNLVSDGKFEYIIATHAHQDHIAGFVGNAGTPRTGILYNYQIDNIIQFSMHDTTSGIYNDYVTAVNYAEENGANVYTCLELYNNPSTRTISLGKDMSMTILYQKYYEQKASGENNYSVCTLFTYKDQHYLFTGDLESSGEKSLVESNELPHCELYKGGHHGSKTSSSSLLMEAITPKVVCVCCCCGSNEYSDDNASQFPTQEFVDRVGIYTEYIFVTTIATNNDEHEYTSMNGNIVFSSNGFRIGLNCSNNNSLLKDTDWFKTNRTWPSLE